MALFFTSDSHFGDHRVLNIWKRPFGSVAEMDLALVDAWNSAVGAEDEVWHLGDFARRPGDVPALLEHRALNPSRLVMPDLIRHPPSSQRRPQEGGPRIKSGVTIQVLRISL